MWFIIDCWKSHRGYWSIVTLGLTLILPGGGSTDPPDFVLHFIQNNAQQTPPINL